jgi:hypothetical protein
MRALPPPPGAELDLGEGLPFAARQVIEEGERALVELRKNSVERWISAGAAWKALQQGAMYRSGSNSPVGRRYNQIHATLVHAWPQLAKVDKATRSNAIWLFDNAESVLAWLATLTQKERDRWTHPAVIRRHFERRHPALALFDRSTPRKPRSTRATRV